MEPFFQSYSLGCMMLLIPIHAPWCQALYNQVVAVSNLHPLAVMYHKRWRSFKRNSDGERLSSRNSGEEAEGQQDLMFTPRGNASTCLRACQCLCQGRLLALFFRLLLQNWVGRSLRGMTAKSETLIFRSFLLGLT